MCDSGSIWDWPGDYDAQLQHVAMLDLYLIPPCSFNSEVVRQAFHEKLIAQVEMTVQSSAEMQILHFNVAARRQRHEGAGDDCAQHKCVLVVAKLPQIPEPQLQSLFIWVEFI